MKHYLKFLSMIFIVASTLIYSSCKKEVVETTPFQHEAQLAPGVFSKIIILKDYSEKNTVELRVSSNSEGALAEVQAENFKIDPVFGTFTNQSSMAISEGEEEETDATDADVHFSVVKKTLEPGATAFRLTTKSSSPVSDRYSGVNYFYSEGGAHVYEVSPLQNTSVRIWVKSFINNRWVCNTDCFGCKGILLHQGAINICTFVDLYPARLRAKGTNYAVIWLL